MSWFLVAIIGYAFLAVAFILDKFILTKSVGKPIVYAFYSTIFLFGALVAWPFGVELLQGVDWLWALVSGCAFGLALWTMFIALKTGEATHIHPFNGAMVTVSSYALASVFLGEHLTNTQLVAVCVLVLSSFLLSFEKSKKHSGFHVGFLWAALAGVLFAVSHVSAKYLYGLYPFITGFVWTRATTGIVGLLLLLSPTVRRAVFRKKKKKAKTVAKRHAFSIVVVGKALGIIAVILIQFAMAIGSVSLVLAMSGLQYVIMFLLILFMTKFFPKVFKEYFTKREVAVEVVALALVLVGSALLVM